MRQYEGDWDDKAYAERARGEAPEGPIKPLTPRQLEALRLYAELDSQKQVAKAMHIALQTVKNLLTGAYDRLGVDNQLDAFRRMGWLKSTGTPEHVHIFTCYCGFTLAPE